MLSQVKKTFKPEFINRLSGKVVFSDMDHDMASRILDKKLKELQKKLDARQVTLSLTDASHDFLLQKGFTHEYGAREMDRVIAREVKPLLMREILFGGLQKGGKTSLDVTEGKLHLMIEE
jgi:ATP-dependent Clp protease ATP-binding subunit ClpA